MLGGGLMVGPGVERDGGGDGGADLALFVGRLAAGAPDPATAAAVARTRGAIARSDAPPGLLRLAEALAAGPAELPPPRRPTDDPAAVAETVRSAALSVLEGYDAAALAETLTALLDDGCRVLVTAASGGELAAVRAALGARTAGLAVPTLPALPPAEIRELRWLHAATSATSRARLVQHLPAPADLADVSEVARLCERAVRPPVGDAGAAMVPGLLAPLAEDRRAAVIAVAGCVIAKLSALPPDRSDWTWRVLSDLIYGRGRPAFDRLQQDVAGARHALDRVRGGPPVSFLAPLPAEAVAALHRYLGFLADGGRARQYFRSAVQRDVLPVLSTIRVGTHIPETEPDLARVVLHLQIDQLKARVHADCAELGVPLPRTEQELHHLADGIDRVAAAARSVSSLRHDVLFLADSSPLAVPDVATAHTIATAVLAYAEHGCAVQAGRRLDELAATLASACPVDAMAPEHEAAVAALRARDAAGYVDALAGLAAARRQLRDEQRRAELQDTLHAVAPELATAWAQRPGRPGSPPGLAAFVRISDVLTDLPGTDTCDVVLVLGAAELGVSRLLLTAAAPRLVAVLPPGVPRAESPSLLSVLSRAGAVVLRGETRQSGNAAVRPLAAAGAARRSNPGPRPAQRTPVGQAGA